MKKLKEQTSEYSWGEQYLSEAIILGEGELLNGTIKTYNIRIYNGNPSARSADLLTGNILKNVPVQTAQSGVETVSLEAGEKVLVGFFDNHLNSPRIVFDKTYTNNVDVPNVYNGTPIEIKITDTTNLSEQTFGDVLDGKGTTNEVITYAKSFIGKLEYSQANRYGINNGGNTADCSSYVEHVFNKYGYIVGSTTAIQYGQGEVVGNGNCSDKSVISKMKAGDIVLVSTDDSFAGNGAHAGIFIGDDNVIHMGSTNKCNTSSLSNYFFSNSRWKKYAIRRHLKLTQEEAKLKPYEFFNVAQSYLGQSLSLKNKKLF